MELSGYQSFHFLGSRGRYICKAIHGGVYQAARLLGPIYPWGCLLRLSNYKGKIKGKLIIIIELENEVGGWSRG
jgi:hypothetical protein